MNLMNAKFLFPDYVKSCATLEVCRQIILALDVSFFSTR